MPTLLYLVWLFVIANQLMMMPHNTKFGNKMFGCSEAITWAKTYIKTLCCDLDLECSCFFFHKTIWLMMMYDQTMFGCRRINGSKDVVERVIFQSHKPSM